MARYRVIGKDYKNDPWSRQEGETNFQYARFRTFLELGRGRSLAATKALLAELGDQIKPDSLQELASTKRWRDRAQRWDNTQDQASLEKLAIERESAIKRHKQAAKLLFEKAMQAIETFDPADMLPGDVIKFLNLAYSMEAKLYNTSLVNGKNREEPEESELDELSDTERRERLIELARELESRASAVD